MILPFSTSGQSGVEWEKAPIDNRTERNWKEGWLKVPENRKVPHGRSNIISLPFILSETNEKNDASPLLIMSGGPGNGSLHMANGSVYAPWGKNRDLIVMDQRGTLRARPYLNCPEIDSARIQGVRAGKNRKALKKDRWKAVKACYKRWKAKGVDLDGYHTLESVEDLEDLRKALDVDSWVLYGMSYSCNLMAAYAQTYPERVDALILDSPLPHHANYDEDAPLSYDRAFKKALGDEQLYRQWTSYLDRIKDSLFTYEYEGKNYKYGAQELIYIVDMAMGYHQYIRQMPEIVRDLINGKHGRLKEVFSSRLSAGSQAKAMRYSVFMTEDWPEQSERLIAQNKAKVPWLKDYPINDISAKTARIWKVRPIYREWTWPQQKVNAPTLILSGEWDPWTPPAYGKMMKELFPRASHKIYEKMTHLPGFSKKGMQDIKEWLVKIGQ